MYFMLLLANFSHWRENVRGWRHLANKNIIAVLRCRIMNGSVFTAFIRPQQSVTFAKRRLCFHQCLFVCLLAGLLRKYWSNLWTFMEWLDIISGVGVRLKKWGDKNWEEWRGGSGEGLYPPQLGVWGLAPRKKSILR